MTDNKKLQVVFAPGCFDDFEGTQEELDALTAEIQQMVESGSLFENSQPVDFDELIKEDPELAQKLQDNFFGDSDKRNLQ